MAAASPEIPARPFFSVVIPTWNRAQVVRGAISSVEAQAHPSWELLVVDDGSQDDTELQVAARTDRRIRFLRQDHRGVSAARNLGLSQARGKFVTFLDSDDEADPEWLRKLAERARPDDVGVVCCGARVISGARSTTRRPASLGPAGHDTVALFLAGTYAVRRSLLESVGGFDEALAFSENNELGLRLVAACRAAGLRVEALAEPLVTYHRRRLRRAQAEETSRLRLEAVERILDRHEETLRQDNRVVANYQRIAGVAAARLGDLPRARRYFLCSWRANPWDWRPWGQLALTLVPALGHRIWFRSFE